MSHLNWPPKKCVRLVANYNSLEFCLLRISSLLYIFESFSKPQIVLHDLKKALKNARKMPLKLTQKCPEIEHKNENKKDFKNGLKIDIKMP